ncbi:MAG: heme exporter protein CcmB [Methanobacteriota archaeon]|nr:MAG: heme exporter protein CcmB [Euryarchaeota archaeon]
MTSYSLALAVKDLKVEFRTLRMIVTMLIFSLMVVMAFRFAFLFYNRDIEPSVAPILWVTFTFAGMFGLVSSFSREKDTGSLQGLMLCPTGRWSIYLGKLLSNLALLLIVDFSALLFFAVFFNFDFHGNILPLIGIVILGTVAFAVIGTLIAALSVNARGRESLLTILMVPLIIMTILLPSIDATSKVLESTFPENEIRMLAMFSIVYLALSYVLFYRVMEG